MTLVYTLMTPHSSQNCNSYEGLEKVTSTLGPIVAAIIGYYFGQRPIQRLTRDAEQAVSERDRYRRGYAETAASSIGFSSDCHPFNVAYDCAARRMWRCNKLRYRKPWTVEGSWKPSRVNYCKYQMRRE